MYGEILQITTLFPWSARLLFLWFMLLFPDDLKRIQLTFDSESFNTRLGTVPWRLMFANKVKALLTEVYNRIAFLRLI